MALHLTKTLRLHYIEQRRSPRLSCFLPVAPETQKKYGIAHVADLSLNGIGVVCQPGTPFLTQGQLIEIKVLVPGQGKPVELMGQKIYQQSHLLGLKFVGSQGASQKHLQNFYLQLCSAKNLEEGRSSGENETRAPSAGVAVESDKRAAERKPLQKEFWIELTSKAGALPIKGKVLDESRYGVSFVYESNLGVPLFFKKGDHFTDGVIHGQNKTIRTGPAKVCHLTPLPSHNGKRVIKVGLAIGNQPQKPECSVHRIDLKKIKTEPSNGAMKSQKKGIVSPIIAHFKNRSGENIVGLLNTTFGETTDKKVPVIVIPPGYGQRKEAASLLTQILIHTFAKQGKDLAVLRFDFTRTLGESYTDWEGELEGGEYLTFTFSKGVEDLGAAIQFAEKNTHFNASEIILLSSCFASPMVRRVLVEGGRHKISAWVNFFGITNPADWMTHQSKGADCLDDFLAGKRKGIVSFSDTLINIDRLNEDLLKHNLASFDDALREMPQIAIPVTWICGEQDSSVSMDQIRELMTLPAPAPRKMISLDAQQLHFQHVKATPSFYLITQEIFAHLHHKKVTPAVPDPKDFKELHQKEWSRLK